MAYDAQRGLSLGGIPLNLAREDGWPRIRHTRLPSEQEDLLPFREHISFGYLGMGSSLAAVPGQFDYSNDVNSYETWGELAPGLLHAKQGLALDNPVTALAVATPSPELDGPNSPATTGETGTSWSNESNIVSSNDTNASATVLASATTAWLTATNFSFAVTASGTLTGVVVTVEIAVSGILTANPTLEAQLIIGGSQTGSIKSVVFSSTSDTIITFGGDSDLWGNASISEAQAEASNFGVAIRVTNNQSVGSLTITVDHVAMSVYFAGANFTRLLYIGAGQNLVKRSFRISGTTPTLATIETKTFSHGSAGSPSVSSILVAKQGNSPGDGFILIGFEGTAGIQQIDAISPSGADTYRLADGVAEASPAHAGQMVIAPGADNTETLIFKSTGSSGQASGPFSRVQSSAISGSTKNFGTEGSWVPATASSYQVDLFGSKITSLATYQRGLVVGKPEGLSAFDENAGTSRVMSFESFRSDENGRMLLPWQQSLLALTKQDIVEYPLPGDANIGLSTLISNLSAIGGSPTGLTSYGRQLYAAYWDGGTSYLVLMRRRGPEDVPHEMVIHPLTSIVGAASRVMLVATDADDNVWLFYGVASNTANKYDVGYTVLDPSTKRRYASGGTWFSTRQGTPDKLTVLDRLIFYAKSVDANNRWNVAISWEDGTFESVGDGTAITATGRNVKTFTLGTNDRGYQFQIRLTCTTNSSANRPRLRSFGSERIGEGGITVEGSRQAGYVDRFEVEVDTAWDEATGYGGEQGVNPDVTLPGLAALQGTTVPVIWQDWYGDTTARSARVESVGFVSGSEADQPHHGKRRVQIAFRVLVAT